MAEKSLEMENKILTYTRNFTFINIGISNIHLLLIFLKFIIYSENPIPDLKISITNGVYSYNAIVVSLTILSTYLLNFTIEKKYSSEYKQPFNDTYYMYLFIICISTLLFHVSLYWKPYEITKIGFISAFIIQVILYGLAMYNFYKVEFNNNIEKHLPLFNANELKRSQEENEVEKETLIDNAEEEEKESEFNFS